jgi:hypothetical protein
MPQYWFSKICLPGFMKKNNLLKVQQYISYVGFLLVLVTSTLCLSFGCGDAFFPSQMPILPISKVNKSVVFEEKEYQQFIKMDYHSDKDSLCLKINDQCMLLDDINYIYNLGLFLSYPGTSSQRRSIIDLRIQKDIPYKYVEKLLNNLRLFNNRKILLRTNTVGEAGGTTGVNILLPPPDEVYFAALHKQGLEHFLLPPISGDKFYWSPFFNTNKVRPIHIRMNQAGTLF